MQEARKLQFPFNALSESQTNKERSRAPVNWSAGERDEGGDKEQTRQERSNREVKVHKTKRASGVATIVCPPASGGSTVGLTCLR
jgi:hypothetical protein